MLKIYNYEIDFRDLDDNGDLYLDLPDNTARLLSVGVDHVSGSIYLRALGFTSVTHLRKRHLKVLYTGQEVEGETIIDKGIPFLGTIVDVDGVELHVFDMDFVREPGYIDITYQGKELIHNKPMGYVAK